MNTLKKLSAALFILFITAVLVAFIFKKTYLDEIDNYEYRKKCIISVHCEFDGDSYLMSRIPTAVSELKKQCSEEIVVINTGLLINPDDYRGLKNEDIKGFFSLFLEKSSYDCTVLSPGDFMHGKDVVKDIITSADVGVVTVNMDGFEYLSSDNEKNQKCREISAISSVGNMEGVPESLFSASFFEKPISGDRVNNVEFDKSLVFIQDSLENYFEVFSDIHMKNEFSMFIYELYPEANAVVFLNSEEIPLKKIDPAVKYISQPTGSIMLMKIRKLHDKNGEVVKADVENNLFFLRDFTIDEEIIKARKDLSEKQGDLIEKKLNRDILPLNYEN